MSAIEFKDVKKTFKDGDTMIEALKETNFSVEKGEFCRHHWTLWFR
ncbi:ABC transporter ATP-binding protein [Enterococcus sp. HSIEG1]|nr:ABC transporter ATP-binding protein [Enterococcus sp. HSIEG1]